MNKILSVLIIVSSFMLGYKGFDLWKKVTTNGDNINEVAVKEKLYKMKDSVYVDITQYFKSLEKLSVNENDKSLFWGNYENRLFIFPNNTYIYLKYDCFVPPSIADRGYWDLSVGGILQLKSDNSIQQYGLYDPITYRTFSLYAYRKGTGLKFLLIPLTGSYVPLSSIELTGEEVIEHHSFEKQENIDLNNFNTITEEIMREVSRKPLFRDK